MKVKQRNIYFIHMNAFLHFIYLYYVHRHIICHFNKWINKTTTMNGVVERIRYNYRNEYQYMIITILFGLVIINDYTIEHCKLYIII